MMKMKSIAGAVLVTAVGLGISFGEEAKKERDEDRDGKGHGRAAAVFDAVDENDDEKITPKELADSKRFEDSDRKDVGEVFKKKDLNNDGAISKKEFIRTFGPRDGGKGTKKRVRKGNGKGDGKGGGKG